MQVALIFQSVVPSMKKNTEKYPFFIIIISEQMGNDNTFKL